MCCMHPQIFYYLKSNQKRYMTDIFIRYIYF